MQVPRYERDWKSITPNALTLLYPKITSFDLNHCASLRASSRSIIYLIAYDHSFFCVLRNAHLLFLHFLDLCRYGYFPIYQHLANILPARKLFDLKLTDKSAEDGAISFQDILKRLSLDEASIAGKSAPSAAYSTETVAKQSPR